MHSQRFRLTAALAAQLQALAAVQSEGWLDNPPLPMDLKNMPQKALFILSRGDRLLDQPGVREERRVMRLLVGAVCLTDAGISDADELHFAARDKLKSLSLRQALLAAGGARDVREVEIEPEVPELATVGAVLMSAYEIEYQQTYPSFDL